METNRSQGANKNQTNCTGMDEYSDNDSDISLPGVSSRDLNAAISNEQMVNHERDHERLHIEQRFFDMNRQICELISPVRILTEKITSSK